VFGDNPEKRKARAGPRFWGFREAGAGTKFFSQVIENCEVIFRDMVNRFVSRTKNRLMTRLIVEWGLRLRRVEQRFRI
jgi:hypothetical protein